MEKYTLRNLSQRLTQYDEAEARSIIRLLLNESFNISFTDICCGALEQLSSEDSIRLEQMMTHLQEGVPVQYVIGTESFYGRRFAVAPGVLIPRPETEELCHWIITDSQQFSSPAILDIGTGSGCIAITLALEIASAKVTAWDISNDALVIARNNAERHEANIDLANRDALQLHDTQEEKDSFDIIVSNPPYICHEERKDMEAHVLDHEPSLALFVPDDDPLLFYRHIADYSCHALKDNGRLFFEINPIYAEGIINMLEAKGFTNIELRHDEFKKARMIAASLKKP